MLKHTVRALALALLASSPAGWGHAATWEDIQFWVGSGTNRAALVIDWNDGTAPESLLWGYRWNGAATGRDLFRAVMAADPRLFAHLGEFEWGTAIFGVGYDLNHSGGYGVTPPLAFDAAGLAVDVGASDAQDARVPSDPADHFVEGWNTGFWAYYLKDEASEEWASAMTGADGRALADGAWDGYRFAAGFEAAAPSAPVPARSLPFAVEVVAARGPFGAEPYDDPVAVLGMPSTDFYDPWGEMSGGTAVRRVKLVESAYHLDRTRTQKLLTTLGEGSYVVVRFEQPIHDDPAHPFGMDLLVFGNALYASRGFVSDGTDLNALLLAGGAIVEPMKVSVSPGYTGAPGQNPADAETWEWYRYDEGPYADTAFPTQAYRWNRTQATWSQDLMDFTKPVNPAFGPLLEAGGPGSWSAAEALDLYDGSGGGTGFDLAESGFAAIQYVKVEGLPGWAGGELDAFARVRPMVLGDSLTVAPENLARGAARLHFRQPARPAAAALVLDVTALSGMARVTTAPLAEPAALAPYGRVLNGGHVASAPLLGSDPVTLDAHLQWATGASYQGDGQDLALLRQVGADWEDAAFRFDADTRSVLVPGGASPSTYALLQVLPPRVTLVLGRDDEGEPLTTVRFAALPGWAYTLERTADFVRWDAVATQTPSVAGETALGDPDTAGGAFYRVRLHRP